jgi:hypothetical protein
MRRASLAIVLVTLATLGVSTTASAAESAHGPFYVQGSPLGTAVVLYPGSSVTVGNVTFSSGGTLAYYRVDAEFGYHFSGRADGFTLGIRQAFLLGWGSAGVTSARVGYDIIVPIGDEMEVGIDPYAHLGAAYPFNGGDAGFLFGFGADVKLFFERKLGLYAFVRPFEIGFLVNKNPLVPILTFAGGLGYAF